MQNSQGERRAAKVIKRHTRAARIRIKNAEYRKRKALQENENESMQEMPKTG